MRDEYRKRFASVIGFVEKSLHEAVAEAPVSHRDLLEKGLGLGRFAHAGKHSKRLRGTVAALIHGASQCASSSCRHVCTLPELVHAASLVVDDLQDGHPSRWGRPSLWVTESPPLAMNTAIMMLALAHSFSHDLGAVTDKNLVTTLTAMLEGQIYDLRASDLHEQGLPGYLRIAEGKTGVLLAFAARLGGHAYSSETQEYLSEWAMATGVAHQLHDDTDDLNSYTPAAQIPTSNALWFLRCEKGNGPDLSSPVGEIHAIARDYAEQGLAALEKAEIPVSLRNDLAFISEVVGKRKARCGSAH